nr:MAG TPA: GIY-YIG nuclease superfamily protein [Caudoviricetes sp.]
MIGIYKITERKNPKNFYIGKSVDIKRRLKEHQRKTYQQTRIPFDKEIQDKGKDAFVYEILEECSKEKLDEREFYWIKQLKAKESGNKFDGGLRDVVGEHNPNAKLTEKDVIKIRKAYQSHLNQKQVYEEYKQKITFQSFQNLWQGRSWTHIMPEVFTESNKRFFRTEASKGERSLNAKFTNEEVLTIRKRYVTEKAKDIYKDYQDRISYQAFQQILWGRYYSNVPIYKKKERKWINF